MTRSKSRRTIPKLGETPTERLACILCNLTDIHVNDYKNHVNGKKHKFRIRHNTQKGIDFVDALEANVHEKSEETKKENLECDLCKTSFSDYGFYEIHIGTKRHKKKVRKANLYRKRKNEDENLQRSQIFSTKRGRKMEHRSTFVDPVVKPMREKYKTRTEDVHPKSYICSIAAYWAVELALDDTVPDFKISVNDKKWNSFGDICINIFWKDTEITYVIQFKQITENAKVIPSLTEGKFNIKRQIVGLSEIKHVDDLSKIKFVVFTTCTPNPETMSSVTLNCSVLPEKWKICNNIEECEENIMLKIKPLNTKKKDILNTTDDNENILLVTLDRTYQLPRLYLYANQKNITHYGRNIDEMVRRKFGNCPEIHKKFISYIENWIDGMLGGNFKLNKNDVCLKISELMFEPYIIEPQVRSLVDFGETYQLWNKIMENVDITVVNNSPPITWRMCKPNNQLIENFFEIKIDSITQILNLKTEVLEKIKNTKVKSYLLEDTLCSYEEVPLKTMYTIFWKAGLLPLILFVEDSLDLDLIMKAVPLTKDKRFIFQTSFEINKYSLTKTYKNLKFFTNLDDLKYFFDIILENTVIKVNESYNISLKTIQESDEFFLKTITPDIFYDMCLGRYSFKSAEMFVNHKSAGEEMKLILSDEIMNELYNNLMAEPEGNVLLRSNIEVDKGWLRSINPNLL